MRWIWAFDVAAAVAIAFLSVPTVSAEAAEPVSAREERTIPAKELGLTAPEGLLYSTRNGSLVVIEGSADGEQPAALEMSVFADPLDWHFELPITDALNVTLDASQTRVIWLDLENGVLGVAPLADDDRAKPSTSSVEDWQLAGAAGLAIDPVSGELVVLDPVAREIVRVRPVGDVRRHGAHAYADGRVSRIPLSVAGAELRGIAAHPEDGTICVLSPKSNSIYRIDAHGNTLNTFEVEALDLSGAGAMVFAPSADATDDPSVQNLFVAVSAATAAPENAVAPVVGVVELTISALILPPQPDVSATLVQTIDTSNFDPPSPDAAGLAYLTPSGTLLIADSEVNEMQIFEGVNLFESTFGGTLLETSNTLAFSDEPTGLSYDPVSGDLYVSDDGKRKIFEVQAGGDGRFGTPDDTVTTLFDTRDFGSNDPEGVAYDPGSGDLFIVDGASEEVYHVERGSNGVFDGPPPSGDDIVSNFDLSQFGSQDPEGIAFDDANGTLLIADRRLDSVVQLNTNGTLVRNIDTSTIDGALPSGVVVGPGSQNTSVRNVYVSDRGTDNNSDPNENDGMVYELSVPPLQGGNLPPSVSAGPNRTVQFPQAAVLSGSASDDGNPDPPGFLTTTWSQVSGPAGVQFGNASSPSTTATFPGGGSYVLRLTADDGEEVRSDDMSVTVNVASNQAPVVNAGSPQSLVLPNVTTTLAGSASDDGLPNPPATLTTTWTQLSGPPGVQFANASNPTTSVTFPGAGNYVLRLTGDDTQLTTTSDVSISVSEPGNTPPSVSAGPDQSHPAGTTTISLAGSVSDDGNPIPPGATQITWSQVGGSGVSFANPSNPTTQATLPGSGSFVLRLTAFDGQLTTTDDVVITVGGSGSVFETRVSAPTDDAEERATGRMKVTSSDLELVFDGGGNQNVGMRFTGVTIPNGAAVSNAWIQFQVDEVSIGATSLQVRGERASSAATFTTTNGNISSRTPTGASVVWNPAPWPTVGAAGLDQRTSNIASVIQEIVAQPGWSPGNALAIIVSGTGERVAESWNGNAGAAPLLHVEFDGGGGPINNPPQVDAGTSQSITLPVTTATLSGSASDDGLPDPPAQLTTLWTQVGGPPGVVFGDDTALQTSATFPGAGSFVLRLTADDTVFSVSSDVTVTVIDPSGTPITTESRVSASTDDAEQKASGSVKLGSSDLELVLDGSNQTVGMRFVGLQISAGAVITNAWVQFEVDQASSGAASLEIRGELSPSAATFAGTSGNLSARTTTSALVPWVPAAWVSPNDAGPAQQTPDLTPVIQEIVNGTGWSTSSALVLLVEGTGVRVAESFDGEVAAAPLLHVEYLAGGN